MTTFSPDPAGGVPLTPLVAGSRAANPPSGAGAGPAHPVIPMAGGAEGGRIELSPWLPAAPRMAAAKPPSAVAVRGISCSPVPETGPAGAGEQAGTAGSQQPGGHPQAPAEGARTPDAAPPAGTTYTIGLPAGLALLSLNGREHYMARHRAYQSLKKSAWAMILNARVPRLRRVEITAVYDPPDRRQRDPDNIAASLKPCVDALVAARVIPSDDSRYVTSVRCEIGAQVYPRGRLRLIIREVAA